MRNFLTVNWIALFAILLLLPFAIWGMCIEAYSVTGNAMYAIAAVATGNMIWSLSKIKSKSGNVIIGCNNKVDSQSIALGPRAIDQSIKLQADAETNEE